MTLDTLIMLVGGIIALLAVLPRFPEPWQSALLLACGIAVIVLGIIVRRRAPEMPEVRTSEMFSDSAPLEN